jgi:hypothetical protein
MEEIGRDLRSNLITVPSCDLHNSAKSKDDEFLRATILMVSAESSDAGRSLFLGKLLRAANRKPKAHQAFFDDKGAVSAGTKHVLRIDRERFDRCVDHIARALFDAYKRAWTLPIAITSPNLFGAIEADAVVPHRPTVIAIQVSRQLLGPEPVRGENPDVFKYRLRYDEGTGSYALAAIFYDVFEIYTFSSPSLVEAGI